MSSYSKILGELARNAQAGFVQLASVTQNINGLTQDGYKAKRVVFSDLFPSGLKEQIDFSPGTLKLSKDPNDVALYGRGFFKLSSKEGKSVYKTNLKLALNKDRFLTSEGYLIDPPIKVPLKAKELKISEEGKVEALLGKGKKLFLGKLSVVNFSSPQELSFDGFVYQESKESGQPISVDLGKLLGTFVKQGALQGSNTQLPIQVQNFNEVKNRLSIVAQMIQTLNTLQREEFNTQRQVLQGI